MPKSIFNECDCTIFVAIPANNQFVSASWPEEALHSVKGKARLFQVETSADWEAHRGTLVLHSGRAQELHGEMVGERLRTTGQTKVKPSR